jgi:hypothetical protein
MTPVTQHFKREAESDLGVGMVYLEVTDGWPSRQVEVYGATWWWGDETNPEHLADQPLDALELGKEHETSAADFERVWQEALDRSGEPS